jgi:hypothetical protein
VTAHRDAWLWGADRDPPPGTGKDRGRRCVIVASARCVWGDLSGLDLGTYDVVIGVNDAGFSNPAVRFESICTLHGEFAQPLRWLYGRWNEFIPVYSHEIHPGVAVPWRFETSRGTSGLYAVKVALARGFDRVMLAGLPFDATGHVHWPPDYVPDEHCRYGTNDRDRQLWQQVRDMAGTRVRSRSGWTAELFGTDWE